MIDILKCNLTRFLITSWNHNIYGISLCALSGPRPWPLQTLQHSLLYLRLNSDRYQVSHSDQESSDLNNLLSADSVDPPVWSLQPSYTMPLLSSGHKTGLTSFYAGTLPRARLEHMAATCSRSVAGGRNCFWHWEDWGLSLNANTGNDSCGVVMSVCYTSTSHWAWHWWTWNLFLVILIDLH